MSNNRERDTRSQRRERERIVNKEQTQKQRGTRRWLTRPIIAVGTALLIATGGIGGSIYYLTPHQDNVAITDVEKDEQALIQGEIDRLGIRKSEAEINLWQEADVQIKEAADSQTLTTMKKLNIVTQAMKRSENPYFKDAATFIDEKTIERKLATKINTSPIDRKARNYYVMRSGTIIIDNTFVLTLDAIAEAIMERKPVGIAADITHEKEHLQNALLTDLPEGATPQQRKANQNRRILDKQELLAEEARGYMQQSKSVIYYLGLTTEPNQLIKTIKTSIVDPSMQIHIVNTIRANNNPADPRWKSYISAMGLAD